MDNVFWIKGFPPPPLAIVLCPREPENLLENLLKYKQAGIQTLVSLLGKEEAARMGIENEGALAEQAGMRFLSFPIFDGRVPLDVEDFKIFVANLASRLGAGIRVGVHCRGSIGRAPLVACCTLMHLGWKPKVALNAVYAARGCPVPETEEQRQWILRYKAQM